MPRPRRQPQVGAQDHRPGAWMGWGCALGLLGGREHAGCPSGTDPGAGTAHEGGRGGQLGMWPLCPLQQAVLE